MRQPKPRRERAYIVKAAESRPMRVEPVRGAYRPPVAMEPDRVLVRALLARKGEET